MDKREWLVVAVVAAVLGVAVESTCASDSVPWLRVILPPEIDPNKVLVRYQIGRGMLPMGMKEPPTSRNFVITPNWGVTPHTEEHDRYLAAQPFKAYMYCPGYQIAAIAEPNMATVWKPQFKQGTVAKLTGTLTDPNGQPGAGRVICFVCDMGAEEWRFFGFTPPRGIIGRNIIAKATVSVDGKFETQLPVFEDDPFVKKYHTGEPSDDGQPGRVFPHMVFIQLAEMTSGHGTYDSNVELSPGWFELKRQYDKPLAVKIVPRPVRGTR